MNEKFDSLKFCMQSSSALGTIGVIIGVLVGGNCAAAGIGAGAGVAVACACNSIAACAECQDRASYPSSIFTSNRNAQPVTEEPRPNAEPVAMVSAV